jgi:hypothetical protein
MRRIVATIAFLLLGWTVVEPISFALAASTVPLCCQKNGKHHCTAVAQVSMRCVSRLSARVAIINGRL